MLHSSKPAVCTTGATKPLPLDVQEDRGGRREEGGREGREEGGMEGGMDGGRERASEGERERERDECTERRVYSDKSPRKDDNDTDNHFNLRYLTNRPRPGFLGPSANNSLMSVCVSILQIQRERLRESERARARVRQREEGGHGG